MKEQEMWLFAIEKFIGRKLKKDIDDNEMFALIDAVEKEELGMGMKLRTSMETIEIEQNFIPKNHKIPAYPPMYQYRFMIHGTNVALYTETSTIRKVAVIKAVGNYAKDRLILQMMEKKSKKSS